MPYSIHIEQPTRGTIVAGINYDTDDYPLDTVIIEHEGDGRYSFIVNNTDDLGDNTISRDCLAMYRDVIIQLIGTE